MRTARRTSATERRRHARAGFTLVEAMMASVILSVSVVGVSSTILASYASDVQSARQHDAVRAAQSLQDELTGLPMDAPSTSDVGLMDFANYSDSLAPGQVVVATAAKTSAKQTSAGTTNTPSSSATNTGLIGRAVGIDTGVLGGSTGTGVSTTNVATATAGLNAVRTVSIARSATVGGTADAAGALAVVTIDVTVGPNQTVRLKRLVSSTEAAANAGGSQ